MTAFPPDPVEIRPPVVEFTPGYELAYAVDPDGDTVPVFTDWTQEGVAEGEEKCGS